MWPERKRVLLVEDDPGDVDLIREALESDFDIELFVATDGEKALSALDAASEQHRLPDLVLLNLNLPKKDGKQVLSAIRRRPDLAAIPVVILTSSDEENDVRETYDLGCNSYVRKPVGLRKFLTAIKSTAHFWLNISKLPAEE